MRHFSVVAFKSQNGQSVAIELVISVALRGVREAARFAIFTLLEFYQLERARWAKAPDHDPFLPGFGHANRVNIPEILADWIRATHNGETGENMKVLTQGRLPHRLR